MKITPIELAPDQILYEQVAERIQRLIADRVLHPGDRLPSVRKLKAQLSISTATVLEAYRLLEDRGLIVARPQSGYYVRQITVDFPEEPTPSQPPSQALTIDTSLAFQVLNAMRDRSLIQLGAAVPAMELMPLAKLSRLMGKLLREDPNLAYAYGSPIGHESLRSELAKRMLNAGCTLTPDNLVVTNGANEAIYLCLQAITRPGDTVAIESPTYFAMLEALKALQLQAWPLPTHPREGLSLLHLEAALKMGKINACMVVSNFSNPLGCCTEDDRKKALVELLNQYNVPLIEDDVYGELVFHGPRPKAIKAFDTENRVLYCSSVSKTIAPGLRIGWCAPGRYHHRFSQMKSILNQCTALPSQLTVAAFLSNGGYDRHLRHLRHTYHVHMQKMLHTISETFPRDTRVTRPQGGHVLWLELPHPFNALKLYEAALQYHISIAPGIMFSPSGQQYANCLRLNTALPWSEPIETAVKTLGQLACEQLDCG
ncbi:MAG: PLP-dependent aminotransferase family protein [Prochlorotrichaceae cyanobacterium]|jgi:DNA-binding transcriptional MocR family regulator